MCPFGGGDILQGTEAVPERSEGSRHLFRRLLPFQPCVSVVKGPVVAEAFIVALALAVFAGVWVVIRLILSLGSMLFS